MDTLLPILEHDSDRQAIIEPHEIVEHRDLPEHCVLCFFREVLDRLSEVYPCESLPPMKSEIGAISVSVIDVDGQPVGVVQAPVGAPLAAIVLEGSIARGGRKFVACGGAGVLDPAIVSGGIIVPTSALRDEGTSYHYLPPTRTVDPSPHAVAAIRATLSEHGCSFAEGMTWTTDAFFRETRGRVARRREEGCISVEMEAAAFFAVGAFRGVDVGQILYGGDDVSGDAWDRRNLGQKIPVREQVLRIAIEACLRM